MPYCKMFLKKYKPNTKGAVISCVKKMNSSSLPLYFHCVFKEKIKKWQSYYDYDDHNFSDDDNFSDDGNFSDSHLSEADSDDGNQ